MQLLEKGRRQLRYVPFNRTGDSGGCLQRQRDFAIWFTMSELQTSCSGTVTGLGNRRNGDERRRCRKINSVTWPDSAAWE
jgi:hypothetical protein